MRLRVSSTLLAAALLLTAAGCATTSSTLQPEHVRMLKAAKVYSVVLQKEIDGEVRDGGPADQAAANVGAKYGAVGIITAAVITDIEAAKRQEAMAQRVAAVRARVRDLDFRRDFRDALRMSFKPQELAGAQSANSAEEDLLRKSEYRRGQIFSELRAASQGQPLLILWTSYRFEPDRYARLIVTTDVELYDANASASSFNTRLVYESVPVAADPSHNGWSTAIRRWEEAGAATYRAAYREAIRETMSMLRLALVDRPAAPRDGPPARELGDKHREVSVDGAQVRSRPRVPLYSTMHEQFPRPSARSARVYFYRARDAFPYFQPAIRVGSQVAGVLGRETFFFVDLAPGEHEVSLQYDKTGFLDGMHENLAQRYGKVRLRVHPGETGYVRMFSSGGTLTGEQRLEVVQRAQADPELAGLAPADRMYPDYVIRPSLLADKAIR